MTDVRALCNLSDEEYAARRKELRETLLPRARGKLARPDGVALAFDASPGMREDLDAFVAFESRCCPGLDFSVSDASGASGELRLEIRGIDPGGGLFADIPDLAESPKPATAEPARWRGLMRSAGLGSIGAFVLFCGVPIGLAAVAGAELAAPLGVLDNPVIIGSGALAFTAGLWFWERRRAASRKAL